MAISDELEKLANLKKEGHLTEEEFEAQKKKILDGSQSASNQQPTFIIQNSASSSAAASSQATVVHKGSCLGTLIKGVVALLVIFLLLDFLVWKSNNDTKDGSQVSTSDNTQKTQECVQVSKEMYYSAIIYQECFVNAKLPEFQKAAVLAGTDIVNYRNSLNCNISEGAENDYAEQVNQAVLKKVAKVGDLGKFCKGETPYFNSLIKKYGV